MVCHTFIFRQLEMWRGMIARLDGMRQQAGFEGLPALDELWRSRDRIIVTTLAEFDTAPVPGWEMVRHVGPVLEDEKVAVPADLPWPATTRRRLCWSASAPASNSASVDKLQRALDALGELPVHVVATTGGIVDPASWRSPPNAIVLNYAAHDPDHEARRIGR